MASIKVLASTLSDNFFYLIIDGRDAYAIDPVDASVAAAALDEHALTLKGIVNTHWHPDHIGGNATLREAFPDCEVIVPEAERDLIESMSHVEATHTVKAGDVLMLGSSQISVHELPGHTMGHVAYEVDGHLLSGDVLFGVGIGHCRSGDVGLAYRSVRRLVEEFSGELRYYPGHDYALRNAEFASELGLANQALRAHVKQLEQMPARTLKVMTLAEERTINPFMRTHEAEVQQALEAWRDGETWAAHEVEGRDPAEVAFFVLRSLRDTY